MSYLARLRLSGRHGWLWLLALSLCAVAACTASRSQFGGEATATTGSGGDGGTLFEGTGGGQTSTFVLSPETSTIVVDNGTSEPVQLSATRNGVPVYPGSWAVDLGSVATVSNGGLVTATGAKGGTVTVTAELGGVTAQATVDVRLVQLDNAAGATPEQLGLLQGATVPDAQTVWTYPYDGTLFPQGLLAPELMWNGSAPEDLFYVRFTGTHVDYAVVTTAPPPSRVALGHDAWVAVSESGNGGPMDVFVSRLTPAAAAATVVADHDWTIAGGSLRGTVYYWANNTGRIVRIKLGAEAPDDFLAAAGISDNCSTCHTVSANGHTLVIGGDVSTSVYDLLNDTPVLQLGSVGKPTRNWAMPAVTPDGRYLVENNAPLPGPPGGSDGMWETATGLKLTGTGLDGVLLDMPAFGPDGTRLAYVDHATHDLGVYEYDSAANLVSNPKTLVPAGSEPSLAGICFPSVSPKVPTGEVGDAIWIVYHRGTYPGSLDTRGGPGNMFMASADDAGVEYRLGRANGDGYPFAAGDRDRNFNYEPTFAPVNAGGYFWVVFTSRRTYGNRLTGGSGAVKQLWVAAIDPYPQPGTDPSYPAFWVPGQDLATLNMRGFWALDPCIQSGDSCTDSADCCDGQACDQGVCGGPQECAEVGETCQSTEDCCDPTVECVGGECGIAGPK